MAIDRVGNLYAGGEFLSAGGKVSPYIAKCRLKGPAVVSTTRPVSASMRRLWTYGARSNTVHVVLWSAANVTCRIFTMSGREVYREAAFLPIGDNSLRIKTEGLGRGIYMARVGAENESMRFKIIVETP